ncbi:hypothetical protein GCM10027277_51680 [Pseudoduganella ginsengisoli]|uniref:Cell envelope integrity protein TolA n=1 Tax=Pseudoduganella ginsengisoli TaxID=1462440 RepID=A0A6L6Q4M6_9BURK|nr:cell envelope integrity protein TolA [Pseudoduganella ginsengisoli]MTW04389.1 cell envelope integrity protein TolA [Pseudoduganella ginsengisoli]
MAAKPATAGGPYRVPKDEHGVRSLAMATAMHAGLLLFLWIGVHWQNNQPVAVEAEVWDMSIQQAAPPPPEPEPAPEPAPEPDVAPPPPPPVAKPVEAPPPAKEPDIALEKRKAKEKAEKERKEEEKRLAKLKQEEEERKELEKARKLAEKKAAEEKKKLEEKKLEEKKLAEEKAKEEKKKEAEKLAKAKAEEQKKADKRREAEMKRLAGVLDATGVTGTAAKSTAPRIDAGYQAAIRAKVQSNISYSGAKQDVEAVFRVAQLPTGEIISVRKVKSSGNPAYDAAVENAINKSSPLPRKKDGSVDRDLELVFNLKDLH